MRFLRPGLPFLLVVSGLLFVPALGSRGPWSVDELRYAEAARQTGEYGHRLVPHLNGEIYSEKPPLYFLLVVLLEKLTGDFIVAGRLLAALSVVSSGLLLVPLSRYLFGRTEPGWLGAVVFVTTLMGIDRGQQGLIDSLLVSLTTGAAVALILAGDEGTAARRGRLAAVAAVLMGAAVLTKGPVGVLCPVVAAIATGIAFRGRDGVAWPALLAAVAGAAAIGLAWLLLATAEAGYRYFEGMLLAQTARRAVDSHAHANPIWYYVPSVLQYLLPWTFLLPGAAWLAWRRRGSAEGRGAFAAGICALAGFVVFSLISGKRPAYLLPFYPAFALLLGWTVLARARGERLLREGAADALPFATLAALAALAGAGLPAAAAVLGGGPGGIALAALAGAAAVVASVASFRALRRREIVGSTLLATAGLAAAVAGAHLALAPLADDSKSPRRFGAALAAHLDEGEPYVLLSGDLDGRANYYTDREHFEVVAPRRLGAAADRPGRLRVVALDRGWEDLPEEVRARFEIVPGTAIPVGRWGYALHRER